MQKVQTLLLGIAVVTLWSFSCGCRTMPLCRDQLQANRDLPGLWNSITRMQRRELLDRWVNRFLASLLDNGRYQLEAKGATFLVIDPKDNHEDRCQMPTQRHRRMLKDPIFLQRLFQIVSHHRLAISQYLYRQATISTVVAKDVKVWGGNCNLRLFRVESSYWKAISTIYTKDRWGEACQIGQTLKRWRECFTPAFSIMYAARMKRVCR